MEPYSFLSSYTGINPDLLYSMGPLNLNKDEVLTKTEKNKKKLNIFDSPTSIFNTEEGGKGLFNYPSFDTTGIFKDIMDGKKENEKREKDEEYGRMTKYAKDVIGEVDKVAQKARAADFLREGIRSFANFPLIGAQAAMAAAEGINNVTIANMGAMAAQNRLFDSNPTKQKIAGKYFG